MVRNRNVAPAIPFIFVHAAASQVVTTTPTAIAYTHIHYKTNDFHFDANGTRMTLKRGIATSGLYMIYASGGGNKATGDPAQLSIAVYVNGVVCEYAVARGLVSAGAEHAGATIITAIFLNVNDYVEIFVTVDAGTVILDSYSVRCIIEGLPMKGWDNNLGGKERIRGGVSR